MFVALSTLLASSMAFATIKNGADTIINQVSPNTNIGVEVVDLTTGTTLYSRNANRYFIPASNMKLFSDAAALLVLGPDYRFKNQLSTDATQLQAGTLKGSLYLHLPGDPSFGHRQLYALFGQLKSWGITRIEGNVYIDSDLASVNPYAPGWLSTDLVYSYGAPLAPVMIDANRLTVTVNPGSNSGSMAVAEVSDPSKSIPVTNNVTTKSDAKGCGVSFAMDNENQVKVHGCVKTGQWAVIQELAIRNPLSYAKGLVRQTLSSMQIQLDGEIELKKAPSGTLLIATEVSKPISQLIADTLKPSDNLYADSLFLHAAAQLNKSPVNWKEAQELIKEFLQKQTGIDLKEAVMTDGSGLSRYDLLTPHQTVSLLQFLNARFPVSYEYIAALPVSGRDGTLQKRFKTPAQQDLVRAKTGTMTGIHSLSGFLYTINGHTLAFAIYANKLPGTKVSISSRHRYLIDALCDYFLQQKPSTIAWAQMFSPRGRLQFQQNPTQADLQRNKQAKWRRLESVIKQSLFGQAVTVIYRRNELVIQDNHKNANTVWNALQNLRKKYPFAVALTADATPDAGKSQLLWVENQSENGQRVWTIRDSVS